MRETTFTQGQKCQDRFFVRLASTHVQSCAKMVDATFIGAFSLTNQIGELDGFYQMFSPQTNIWVQDKQPKLTF